MGFFTLRKTLHYLSVIGFQAAEHALDQAAVMYQPNSTREGLQSLHAPRRL